MACKRTVTVQSQICGALTVASMISHYFAGEWKNSFVKQSESDLYVVWKCFNIHLILITTLSYSKFESIQLQREESAVKSNESRKMIFIF